VNVELDPELLRSGRSEHLLILALCALGLIGRHRILAVDRAVWDAWASTLPVELADEVRFAWDEGERQEAAGATSARVRVAPVQVCELRQDPMQVDPTTALSLLARPLRVILENGRNDRAFLLAFADKAFRRAIVEAERAGWLVFETAGGIGELKLRVESLEEASKDTAGRVDLMRAMYLCDSDAREPGIPSPEAQGIKQNLERIASAFRRASTYFGRVLVRRAAENYAPTSTVLKWASKIVGADAWKPIQDAASPPGRLALIRDSGSAKSTRRRLLAAIALKELSPETRAVLDMKQGRGPVAHPRTSERIWKTLDAFQSAALAEGFGDGFSASFYPNQTALHDETREVSDFLRQLMERL
jgi:hypothetical protein